jgi:VIT1/CCC1 family predicted Fe2+/Mn2+ transporter
MNEQKALLIASLGVLLTCLAFFTMPIDIAITVTVISFVLGIYGFIVSIRSTITQFKSANSNKNKEND